MCTYGSDRELWSTNLGSERMKIPAMVRHAASARATGAFQTAYGKPAIHNRMKRPY